MDPNNQNPQPQEGVPAQQTSTPPPAPSQPQGPSPGAESSAPMGAPVGVQPPVNTPLPPGRKSRLPLIVGAIVAVLAVAGAVAYFMYAGGDDGYSNNPSDSNSTPVDVASLKSVTFTPGDMAGYTKDSSSTATFVTYLSEDGKCSIAFGTFTAAERPGKDASEVVKTDIRGLQDNGTTVEGPTTDTSLVMKGATNSSVRYKMPTVVIKASKDQKRAIARYSSVVLKDGGRALVIRGCSTADGTPVADEAMQAQEAKVAELKITAGYGE